MPPTPLSRTASGETVSQPNQHQLSSPGSRSSSGQVASQSNLYRLLVNSFEYDRVNSRSWLPVDKLNQLVSKTNVKSELRGRRTARLLRFLQVNRWESLADTIVESARKLFVVFTLLGLSREIRHLLDAGFSDNDFPFSKEKKHLISGADPKKRFQWPGDWNMSTFDAFFEKQWLVQAPILANVGRHRIFPANCPLPLLRVTQFNGKYGHIFYKAKVHSAHQQGLEHLSPSLLVAVKVLLNHDSHLNHYRGNLHVIHTLRNTNHIVKDLETFQQGKGYFFIFPWAEGGNLYNFWSANDLETRCPKLAIWCLQQILGLAEAIEGLHGDLQKGHEFCHGDLSPQHILHFHAVNSYGMLKITGFEVSRLHSKGEPERLSSSPPHLSYDTYRSPETDATEPKLHKVDMWSLGCLYFEFVVWAVCNFKAVSDFNFARWPSNSGTRLDRFYYHTAVGGTEIHPVVQRAFEKLRSMSRCGPETAFGGVLEIIEGHLLQVIIDNRVTAKQLCEKLTGVINKSNLDHDFQDLTGIGECLTVTDITQEPMNWSW
ncbi:hypothetical protein K456DRAFT_1831012 [Colletotrichum gloeosporioides 23]|nr:hypothetical protein K456DRAFT_1831012 [Colletotrichum gloeosporioides 23]